jgi:hypothetical protein
MPQEALFEVGRIGERQTGGKVLEVILPIRGAIIGLAGKIKRDRIIEG